MMLWILIAAMTAFTALSILVPLARSRRTSHAEADETSDEAVYKQQLVEVEKDLVRGLIDDEAASAARTEIARRLLAANERGKIADAERIPSWPMRISQLIAILALPASAFALYLFLGSPDLPDQPLSARLTAPAEDQTVETLIARVERHLAESPEDGQGWSIIAPVYMRVNNPQAAARAYSNAIRLLGPTVDLVTDFGESLTVANAGIVSANARAAFEEAVAIDASAVKARFFLSLALSQEGRRDEAIAAWQGLLSGADQQEPWVPVALAELEKLGGEPLETNQGLPGPNQGQMAAAGEMSEQDRNQMIAGMVSGLAERLQAEGGSAEEWMRLIRAYSVLGEPDKAEKAIQQAALAYKDDASALGQINAIAEQSGLKMP